MVDNVQVYGAAVVFVTHVSLCITVFAFHILCDDANEQQQQQ